MKKRVADLWKKTIKFIKKQDEKKIYKYLLVFFFVLAIIPILIPGIPIGHDVHFHLSRIEGITEGLRSGSFPVLIYPNYLSNYGYANGIFYPDIFLYIPSILHLWGLSTVVSYKIFMLLITFFIFFSMYFCVKKITKSTFSATCCAIIYLMSSYRITDTFIRAALGESLTFIFIPLVILGLYYLLYDDEGKWKYLTIGLVGVVLSHLLSGILCIIVVAFFALANIKKLFNNPKRLKKCLLAGLLAIGITLFFTLPLLEMMMSDNFHYQTYSDGMMTVMRSVNPFFVLLEIPYNQDTWIPSGIGIIFIFLTIYLIKTKEKDSEKSHFKNVCLISALIFLSMSTSLFPWRIFGKILGMIQFPWRLYILVTILSIIGFSLLIKNKVVTTENKTKFMLIIMMFSLFTYGIQTLYIHRYGLMYKVEYTGVISWGEYVPLDVDVDKFDSRGEIIVSNHQVTTSFTRNGTNLIIDYSNNNYDDTYIEVPLLYYKGYVAESNNETLDVSKGENGVLKIKLSKQSGVINVYYGFTNIRKIANIISLVSILLYFILQKKEKRITKK